ncbi:glycosyltransferase family 2 protein [Synechococcus sp. RedBA-s]|uniref:glycosyltransferase family 2 protein n=1 Tax=Synechococcus sp. RedBA-s TaxID=2823741 RepID=UPI0020CD2694|nr:glycosyltransferase family 2 protein [Synechococcus sp. RedBA-s]MCP9799736.1 glycosyltransferase family 2 protein [Synechococcus sp. RedBA-s]
MPVVLSVAYHSLDALQQLGTDLARQSLSPIRWLVVDNSPLSAPLRVSDLSSASCGPELELELVAGSEGDGFGAGCNRGFEHLARRGWGGWIWLLNPDTALPTGHELERLSEALAQLPPRALLGTAVRAGSGELEPSGGWIDPGLDFRRRRVDEASLATAAASATAIPGGAAVQLDWLSGCSLLMRPSAHSPPARFDPAFPLYYEDMDLCLRLGEAGAPVLWWPALAVTHQRGAGSHTPSERRQRLSTLSYLRFLRRHRPGWVLALRNLRLLLMTLLRLPGRPKRSWATLVAMAEAMGPFPTASPAVPPRR